MCSIKKYVNECDFYGEMSKIRRLGPYYEKSKQIQSFTASSTRSCITGLGVKYPGGGFEPPTWCSSTTTDFLE